MIAVVTFLGYCAQFLACYAGGVASHIERGGRGGRSNRLPAHVYRLLPELLFPVVKCYVGAFLAYFSGAEEPEYYCLAAGLLLGLVPLTTFANVMKALYESSVTKILTVLAPTIVVGLVVANKRLLEFILTGEGTWQKVFPYDFSKVDPLDPSVMFGFLWSLAVLTVALIAGVYVLRKPPVEVPLAPEDPASEPVLVEVIPKAPPKKMSGAAPRAGRSVGDIISDYVPDKKE